MEALDSALSASMVNALEKEMKESELEMDEDEGSPPDEDGSPESLLEEGKLNRILSFLTHTRRADRRHVFFQIVQCAVLSGGMDEEL